jgi:hypothetical protein
VLVQQTPFLPPLQQKAVAAHWHVNETQVLPPLQSSLVVQLEVQPLAAKAAGLKIAPRNVAPTSERNKVRRGIGCASAFAIMSI